MLAKIYVNDRYKEQRKLQENEANSTLIIITNKVMNKIAGCLLDSRGVFATMYVNDKYKEQRKEAGI